MNYKILSYIFLILFAITAIIAGYQYFNKPETTTLQRPQQEEILIGKLGEAIAKIDTLQKANDSLKQVSQNNVKVIVKTVYKEQETIITEPLTDSRVGKTKKYLSDFYDTKIREIGIDPSPEIKLPDISLTNKEFKGAELLISDYGGERLINIELNKQIDLYVKSDELHKKKVDALNEIIGLKEQQIVKLERTPVPIETSHFWREAGLTVGGLAVGFAVGIIYQNSR